MSKILLSMPDKMLKDIDIVCDAEGYERSEYVRVCIRERLYGSEELHNVKEVQKEQKKEKPIVPVVPKETVRKTAPTTGWCNLHVAHEFVSGKQYDVSLITYEDENGDPIVDRKWACESCVNYYKRTGKGVLYYI